MPNDDAARPVEALALGDIEPAADLLKSLGHPQRLMIVCALMNGERAVSELERELAIRQPSLSQHLGSLRDAGIIASRRRAKSVIYKISDLRVARIVDVVRSVFAPQHPVSGLPKEAPRAQLVVEVAARSVPQASPRAVGEAALFARVRPRELA